MGVLLIGYHHAIHALYKLLTITTFSSSKILLEDQVGELQKESENKELLNKKCVGSVTSNILLLV